MKIKHLLSIAGIVACTSVAWFLLGAAMFKRTMESSGEMTDEVANVWGPVIAQQHPQAWFDTPNAPGGRAVVLPETSKVRVTLDSDPKQRGLLWHRTYGVGFDAKYVFSNPTRIPQTFYISFPLPESSTSLNGFDFRLGDEADGTQVVPGDSGVVTRAVTLPASGSIALQVAYATRGTDSWRYEFPDNRRISGFQLDMTTNYEEISFPVGTGSPSERQTTDIGWELEWDYPDMLAAASIGMDMPKRLNAGPVASRIAFFAPVSLLFFVTVVLLLGAMRRIELHPVHVFFVAAGFFAFHLLFAYLVDLLPLAASFSIASIVSLVLVCGYLRMVGGNALLAVAAPAQAFYLVVFSASFFIDGLTGITLTVLAVVTLALLMFLTARVDWKVIFSRTPPPLPADLG